MNCLGNISIIIMIVVNPSLMSYVYIVLGYFIKNLKHIQMKRFRNLMLLLVAVSLFSSCLVQDGPRGGGYGHRPHGHGHGHGHHRGHW